MDRNLRASLCSAYSSSKRHLKYSTWIAVFGVGSFFLERYAACLLLWPIVAAVVILVVDVYLIWLLWLAADTSLNNCTNEIKKDDAFIVKGKLPRRDAAAFQIVLFAIAIVFSAACLYINAGQLSKGGAFNALYFSVVTIATVGYGDIVPMCHVGKLVAMVEITSGVLLLVYAFPLVISRLSLLDKTA